MTTSINFSNPNWINQVDKLEPQKGFCIFIDIVGSTSLKSLPLKKWLAFFHNHIGQAICKFLLFQTFYKILADGIMIWINEEKMKENGENALTIFNFLYNIAKEDDEKYFKKVRISTTYCTSVYEVTFDPDKDDVYGQEIDLCFRLNSNSHEREVLMNEGFYKKLIKDFNSIGNQNRFPYVQRVQGPWSMKIKGFTGKINVYKLP